MNNNKKNSDFSSQNKDHAPYKRPEESNVNRAEDVRVFHPNNLVRESKKDLELNLRHDLERKENRKEEHKEDYKQYRSEELKRNHKEDRRQDFNLKSHTEEREPERDSRVLGRNANYETDFKNNSNLDSRVRASFNSEVKLDNLHNSQKIEEVQSSNELQIGEEHAKFAEFKGQSANQDLNEDKFIDNMSYKSDREISAKINEKLQQQMNQQLINSKDFSPATFNDKVETVTVEAAKDKQGRSFFTKFKRAKNKLEKVEEFNPIDGEKVLLPTSQTGLEASTGKNIKDKFEESLARNKMHEEQRKEDILFKAREVISNRQLDYKQVKKFSRSLRRKVKGKPSRPTSSKSIISNIGTSVLSLFKPMLLIFVLLIFFLGSIGVGALIANVALTEELPASLLLSKGGEQTSFVYDAAGNEIAKLTGSQNIDREWIALSEVNNTSIVDAFISTEDERFEENIGISPRRIASAVISALTNGGEARHGGSTITQQTVKLLTGEDQRSVQRKIQEWYRAIVLTHQLSKSEIMELYLNLVPMANSYVGIQSASKAYFGKPASDLTLAECAYLAGIPKSPTSYNPRTERGKRNGLRRQRQVLANMYRLGRINKEEYRLALDQELNFKKAAETKSASDVNPYFVEYAVKRVKQDLINKLGYSEIAASRLVGGGGLRIHLTLDPYAQKVLDEVYSSHDNFENYPPMYDNQPERPNSGAVLINNETHEIVAMQGGVGAKTQNLVLNRATDIKRQPGSTIKPVAVYGPAIDLGIASGNTMFQDTPKALDPQRPDVIWPNNYDNNFRGNVLMRFALKESLNTISVQTLSLVGVENAKAYLSNNGWNMTDDQSQLSLGVGAMTHGISPLELTNSFATFASNGLYHEPTVYTRVEDSDGNIILDTPSETVQVFKPSTAYAVTSMLQEVTRPRLSNSPLYGTVARYGSITNGQGISIPTSVKTGTTENQTDQWTVGYTPYYTMGLWYGFDNSVKTTYIPESDAYKVVDVFYNIMRTLHENKEVKQFEVPADTVGVDVSAYTGNLASNATYNSGTAYREYFEEGSPLIPQNYDYSSYSAPKNDNETTEEDNTENDSTT